MLSQTLLMVVLFVVLLALLPLAIKWIQRRAAGGATVANANARVLSALAVGPQQRIVTVEVGPEHARTWLVLGVTAQNITCLFTQPATAADGGGAPASARVLPETFVIDGVPRG